MIETDRVLRPLREAEPAIDRLDTYESPAVLMEALRATWHAVDRTLRTLLRSDGTAPDSIRLTAMSPEQMPSDVVIAELRRREFITIGLAGRMHELGQALERAERGDVRAADADNARDVVRCVTDEVNRLARRTRAAPPSSGAQSASAAGPSTSGEVLSVSDDDEEPAWMTSSTSAPTAAHVKEALRDTGGFRGGFLPGSRSLWMAAGAAVLLAIAVAAVFLLGGASEMEKGVAAFRDDRDGVAEQHFRAALEEDEGNNTARLYLARILRGQGRNEEAADVLRTAATVDSQDAAVRRELGYLFLDLDVAKPAVQQFRRAVEIDPAEPLNWVGLYEALVRDGDAAGAAETLRRAPEEARSMVRQRTGG